MVCSTSMFDDVGVTTGRGVGGRVSCTRPLPWRSLSGFAGVFFATVLGLGVWWSVLCVLVDALWSLQVSLWRAFRVFEVVDVTSGRGVGRLVACWWTTFACSRAWPRLLAVV